ncbi:hypothetical protein [uncultured Vagococcus sp.]|uniref:hypothetical protein n=1 Tax=uncultured Vagococcus sp. TaxID=189676 RepID=UPI0028D336DE|nr:hypothetical protein [uncultured Vagococcus sp.]
MGYFWIYFLAIVCVFSLSVFLMTLSSNVVLVRKLNLPNKSLSVNWLLIIFSLVSLGLLVYLFYLLKVQLGIMA